jgi:Transglycosylase SLT domain
VLTSAATTRLAAQTPPAAGQGTAPSDTRESVCLMIEAAADANGLPVDFFARVIWQESRFEPNAVGPTARNGEHAQGIAQFMPGTAAERRLLDPFNPVEALPKSAEFLAELRRQFGNLGLAAAAYNAGPARVREYLAGTRPLPAETRNYVQAVTGLAVDVWAKPGGEQGAAAPPVASKGCNELMAMLKQGPNPFVEGLQEHINLAAGPAAVVGTRPWRACEPARGPVGEESAGRQRVLDRLERGADVVTQRLEPGARLRLAPIQHCGIHDGLRTGTGLKHDPEKWIPVFRKRSCSNKKLARYGDST